MAETKSTRGKWRNAIRNALTLAQPLMLLAASLLLIFGAADGQALGVTLVGASFVGEAL